MPAAANKKIVIWLGIVAFLAAMFGFFGYYLITSSRRAVAFQDARKAFEVKNYPYAIRLAHQVLKDDPHHLQAILLLADIATAEEQPEREKYWRRRAMMENPLDASSRELYRKALLKARDFEGLLEELRFNGTGSGSVEGDWLAWRAFALFCTGRHAEAKSAAEKLGDGDVAVFVRAIIGANEKPGTSIVDAFAAHEKSENPALRLESVLGSGSLEERLGDDAAAEAMYRVATNLNWAAAAPYYAQFLARRARFRDATDILTPYVKKFNRPDLAIAAGEFLAMQYRPEAIREIADGYPPRDLTTLSVACYFDALVSFASNDVVSAVGSLKNSKTVVKTPFSVFMRIHGDILEGNPDVIFADWLELLGFPDSFNLQHLAGSAIKAWVGDSFRQRADPVKLLPIAEALQRNGRFDLELQRVVLLGKLLNGTFLMSELDDLLKKYPGDKALLKIKEWAKKKL